MLGYVFVIFVHHVLVSIVAETSQQTSFPYPGAGCKTLGTPKAQQTYVGISLNLLTGCGKPSQAGPNYKALEILQDKRRNSQKPNINLQTSSEHLALNPNGIAKPQRTPCLNKLCNDFKGNVEACCLSSFYLYIYTYIVYIFYFIYTYIYICTYSWICTIHLHML